MWIRATGGALINSDRVQMIRTVGGGRRVEVVATRELDDGDGFRIALCASVEQADALVNRIFRAIADNARVWDAARWVRENHGEAA